MPSIKKKMPSLSTNQRSVILPFIDKAGNLPMVRGKSNFYSGARQMFRESRMCSQTLHYATKGEITGMIAHVMVIFINPGRAVFARERCDNFVWRASQYLQNML